ncbi:hypothetical protein PoB_006459400 [Plakobranchus ocellatus]|uniref:Uncharacterized protein n=1 Tax=Plakobranchus ocellatus TaxID=259542 RepID=A0AAV4D1T6_9GAST|nr:hypothetical protein PoB_006459400 [Plakobranchus ocellatus]
MASVDALGLLPSSNRDGIIIALAGSCRQGFPPPRLQIEGLNLETGTDQQSSYHTPARLWIDYRIATKKRFTLAIVILSNSRRSVTTMCNIRATINPPFLLGCKGSSSKYFTNGHKSDLSHLYSEAYPCSPMDPSCTDINVIKKR